MLDQVWEVVAVAVVVAIALVALVVGLLRGRGGRSKQLPPPDAGTSTQTLPPPATIDGSDSEDAPGSVATFPPTPTAPPEPEVDEAAVEEALREVSAPPLEKPQSARGRLARLRARLARSNSAIGNALLALLSRGDLDDAAWEEVEDTLISIYSLE